MPCSITLLSLVMFNIFIYYVLHITLFPMDLKDQTNFDNQKGSHYSNPYETKNLQLHASGIFIAHSYT